MSVVSGSRMRETIHSGHFMVSDFEPESEAQDEEYEVGMPIPQGQDDTVLVKPKCRQGPHPATPTTSQFDSPSSVQDDFFNDLPNFGRNFLAQNFGESFIARQPQFTQPQQQQQQQPQQQQQLQLQTLQQHQLQLQTNSGISIDSSLTKLFQCMSLAYRQKLTSPKWNRFKGVRLRWKDKIRLNNVIWRCWHMQFILKKKTLVCQFASPLDVDQHNKPEAVVMEGKYWKRKLSTVAAEYKKWRLFYRHRIMGWTHKDSTPDLHPVSLDGFDWNRPGTFGGGPANVMFDDDLLMDFTDILFSSLSSNQPFAFPNPREIARAGMVADFIQPGLIQLQPNLEDFMDTLEPLQDYVNSKILPPVPEELETFDSPDAILPDVLPSIMSKDGTTSSTGVSKQELATISSTRASGSTGNPVISSIRNPVAANSGAIQQSRQIGPSATFPAGTLSSDQTVQPSQPNFFQMGSLNDRSNVSGTTAVCTTNAVQSVIQQPPQQTASTSSVVALLQENTSQHQRSPQNQSSPTGPSPRGSFTNRADVFAKPVGKPRSGRSRSGPMARSSSMQPVTPPPPPPPPCPPAPSQSLPLQQPLLTHPQQMQNNMVNSNTLLSHLLTTTTSATSTFSGNAMDKMSVMQPVVMTTTNGPQMLSAANNGPINMMMGAQDMHQPPQHIVQPQQSPQAQQQQPWNPKDANETINPNLPINFGITKPILQMGQQQSTSHVNHQNMILPVVPSTSGNISPPLLPNTPSPPMGPPHGGPGSPAKPFRPKSDTERVQYKEHRRVCHINAEQKRRCNIKNGFDTLHALIPQLNHNPNAKVSKAAMLQKGAEYIRQLKMERAQLKEEIETHRQEVEALNAAINNCQSMLPATGAPVSRQRTNKMTEMFDQWVRIRTTENWKFWIFSILIRPLLDSYNNTVSTASVDELCRTVLAWVDQHCSLVDLRPVVLNSLRYLCTTTDILTNPANLSEEAYRSINRPSRDNQERDPPR